MLRIIHQGQHVFDKQAKRFLKQINNHHPALKITFPDMHKATFIIDEGGKDQIMGGAFLIQRNVATIHCQIGDKLSNFIPLSQTVWTGSILLTLSKKCFGADFECFSKLFYKNLFSVLTSFGHEKKIPFLLLSLPSVEYYSTEYFAQWPYLYRLRPKDTNSRLFQCLLNVSNRQADLETLLKEYYTISHPSVRGLAA
jgi:hypothetical protein